MEFEGTLDPEAETPFVNGVASGANENNTTGSSDNTLEPTVDLAHILTLEFEELVSYSNDPSSGATSSDEDRDAGSESDENSRDSSILSEINRANGIDRNPDNSIIDYIKAKEFHQAWLDRLYAKWDEGKKAFFVNLQGRCELVYLIHKETVKPGCKGGFSAALDRLELASSTAYDWIALHKIRIGEMEDPDAYDSRDDEEEQEKQADGEEGSEETTPKEADARRKSERTSRRRQHGPSPKVTLSLSGPIRKAVDSIKVHFHQADAKAVIQFCVLRVWREIETPLASRGDNDAGGATKSVIPEWSAQSQSSWEAEDASGTVSN